MKNKYLGLIPNRYNLTGLVVGIISGFFIGFVVGDDFTFFSGFVFGLFSSVIIFLWLLNVGKFAWRIILWTIACSLSWYFAVNSAANYYHTSDSATVSLLLGGLIGATLIFVGISAITKSCKLGFLILLLIAGSMATLIYVWCSQNLYDYVDAIGGLTLLHGLWEGLILYVITSFLALRKFNQNTANHSGIFKGGDGRNRTAVRE